MTLYLKYRPQKVADLGLTSVREHLAKVLVKDDLPHAWLLAGPRGTGKTSAARILAKAMNCERKKAGEPCNECEMCLAITSGSAADVVEIDAASNRGIDEIRNLREKVGLAPMQAKYKVYIIDEVHMLTVEAANALLKTLEEPPPNVVFILCTTEAEKLPETVISRCTRVQFKMPSVAEVKEKLQRVAGGEGLKMTDGEMEMIAKAARGSFRDAIKILEQIVAADGDVAGVLGMVGGATPEEFLQLVRSGDRNAALKFVNETVEQGANVRGFMERCVETVREELLAAAERGEPTEGLVALAERLQEAYEQTRTSVVVQLPLEMLVIEMTAGSKDSPKPVSQVLQGESKKEPEKKVVHKTASKYHLEDVTGQWAEVLKQVKPKNHSVEALLRSTRPVEWDGTSLTLEVFYKFHMDKLATDKCREIVETSMAEVFGLDGPVKLALRLGEKKPVGTDKPPADELTGAVEEDIIRAAQEIFKAEVI